MAGTVELTINPRVEQQILEILESALDAGADKMVEVASGAAPRDTGTLADSIHKEKGKKPGEVFVIANPRQPRAPKGYAIYVEFGTSRNRAQPFMIPGLNAAIPTIIRGLRQ